MNPGWDDTLTVDATENLNLKVSGQKDEKNKNVFWQENLNFPINDNSKIGVSYTVQESLGKPKLTMYLEREDGVFLKKSLVVSPGNHLIDLSYFSTGEHWVSNDDNSPPTFLEENCISYDNCIDPTNPEDCGGDCQSCRCESNMINKIFFSIEANSKGEKLEIKNLKFNNPELSTKTNWKFEKDNSLGASSGGFNQNANVKVEKTNLDSYFDFYYPVNLDTSNILSLEIQYKIKSKSGDASLWANLQRSDGDMIDLKMPSSEKENEFSIPLSELIDKGNCQTYKNCLEQPSLKMCGGNCNTCTCASNILTKIGFYVLAANEEDEMEMEISSIHSKPKQTLPNIKTVSGNIEIGTFENAQGEAFVMFVNRDTNKDVTTNVVFSTQVNSLTDVLTNAPYTTKANQINILLKPAEAKLFKMSFAPTEIN